MIRIVICDDEPLANERLRGMLCRFPDVDVVGSASNGRSVLRLIEAYSPDAVLIDIEMPHLDGFDVIEELARGNSDQDRQVPFIVFVSAHPRFAAHAFETGALDFLTKPVRFARLETTLSRVRSALSDRSAHAQLEALVNHLEALRTAHGQGEAPDTGIWVHRWGETLRVDVADIHWVKAEGEYVRLHCGTASYLHRESISTLAARLEPHGFLRVHRSHLVHRDRVAAVRRSRATGTRLVLDEGVLVPVGRTYREAAKRIVPLRV
jgi:DNA-binding LytR/AlgR family response regulator